MVMLGRDVTSLCLFAAGKTLGSCKFLPILASGAVKVHLEARWRQKHARQLSRKLSSHALTSRSSTLGHVTAGTGSRRPSAAPRASEPRPARRAQELRREMEDSTLSGGFRERISISQTVCICLGDACLDETMGNAARTTKMFRRLRPLHLDRVEMELKRCLRPNK